MITKVRSMGNPHIYLSQTLFVDIVSICMWPNLVVNSNTIYVDYLCVDTVCLEMEKKSTQ